MAADLATARNAIPLCAHLRALTGWGDTQLKVHLARLAELEYLLVHRVKTGQGLNMSCFTMARARPARDL